MAKFLVLGNWAKIIITAIVKGMHKNMPISPQRLPQSINETMMTKGLKFNRDPINPVIFFSN